MRVATWDLDGDRASAPARERQRHRIAQVDADVWVLTRADPSAVPGGHVVVASERAVAGELRDVVLTAARLRPLPMPELSGGAAGAVTVAGADCLVVGVRLARHRGPDRSGAPATGAANGPQRWRDDLERLDAALVRLRAGHPGLPLVLAGAFGQTLVGHVVGSRLHRELLRGLLSRHALTAHTAASPSSRAGCAAVDHVCGTTPAADVETWSSVDGEAGLLLGGSRGYVVDLVAPAVRAVL